MSTSIHNGIVQLAASLYGTDDDPVGTVLTRDGLANGLLHAADSYAQVRVNVMFPAGASFANTGSTYNTVPSTLVADQWYPMEGSPFGEWPLTLREDGTPYKLRVRVAIASSKSDPVLQTLRVVIAPASMGLHELRRSVDHIYEVVWAANTNGTTPVWDIGASQGPLDDETLCTVSAADARAWTRSVPIYNAVSAAAPGSVQQCLVAAHVFANSADTSTRPQLYALNIAEYIGT